MMGLIFQTNKKTYLVESQHTLIESTLVESITIVESVLTTVESVVDTSVDFPSPQDARATIDNTAITFFITLFFF